MHQARTDFTPKQVFGIGIKVSWNDDELAAMRKMAAMPVKFFPTKEGRHCALSESLRPSWLDRAGVRRRERRVTQTEEGWRLAYDPAAASVGAPPMDALFSAARAPIRLARGTTDPHGLARTACCV
ncbi:MAG: hypothetical protein WDM89_06630 [Rhizomicrobium sp.]